MSSTTVHRPLSTIKPRDYLLVFLYTNDSLASVGRLPFNTRVNLESSSAWPLQHNRGDALLIDIDGSGLTNNAKNKYVNLIKLVLLHESNLPSNSMV